MGNFLIEKLDGSLGELSSPNGSIIQANGNVTLAAYRGASLHIFAGGSVFIPGVVRITGPETGTAGINFINETLTLSNEDSLTIDGSVHPTVDIRAGTTAFGSPFDNTDTPTSSEIFIRAINFDDIGGDGGRVFLTNQYQPNTSLSGDISIRSIDTIDNFGGGSVTIDSKGKITVAGEVNVSASSLSSFSDLVSGNYIYEGNGGDVTLLANGDINLTRGSGIVSEGLLGGNITLKSGAAIYATNSEVASASYTNQPGLTGGNIKVSATSLFFLRNATLRSTAYRQANGGSVTISATDSVSVTNGAQIGTEVLGQGKAGDVTITAPNFVSLDGLGSNGSSGVVSQVLPRRIGNGNISIDTGSLSITNGAAISTTTKGKGDAGSVKITANAVSLDGVSSNGESSRIQSEVYPQADGMGGTIDIETGSLSVTNGAVISASTAGQKDAGSIQINAREDVRISGDSRLETASFSSGRGGNIDIQPRSLFLMDGAQITSRSEGTGAAGDIIIQTRENLESERSQITATTQSGDGGDIQLTVGDLLLMRNNSQISTTAGNAQAGGNGGNIIINTPFLVAVPIENSDITANAFTGTGGRVNITFAGIYGLEFRPRQTPKSDITASSEYGPQGTFEERNLTGIIAEQGLTNLPTEPVDRSRQITQNCRSSGATAREKNQFIITGRGGIPTSPNEPLQGEAVTTNWVTLDSDIDNKTTLAATTPRSSTPKQLVEAQGWIVDDNGEIVLTTQAPTVTPQGEWFSAADCNMPQG
jgi:large exoprotein involved in heme utilization and adhesion